MAQYGETIVGLNNKAAELKTVIEEDGPAAVLIENLGDAEFALAMKRNGDTYATGAVADQQVKDQAQVVVNPPDGAEVTFEGVLSGKLAPGPHVDLLGGLGTDGTASAAATRTLTSAGAVNFNTLGVKAGDVLIVEDAGAPTDNGQYRIVEVVSDTVIKIDRDWPAAGPVGAGALDFIVVERCVVMPKSVAFSLTIGAATITVTDDGAGVLYGQIAAGPPITAVNGTINYFTGYWTITCDTAPDNATDIDVTYGETVPVAGGGERGYMIQNLRKQYPVRLWGVSNGESVPARVKVLPGY